MYVDPAPGGVEPSSATISPEQGDSGTGAANLQVLLLQSSSSVGQGVFNLDTIRVGTNWADVTPIEFRAVRDRSAEPGGLLRQPR